MTRSLILFLVFLFSHATMARVAISRMIAESDIVIHGKVVETKPSSVFPGYDMTAVIAIQSILMGEWRDSIVEIPFCKGVWHPCGAYYLNEEFVAFLETTPSIKTVHHGHGKVTLEGKLQDSFLSFMRSYLLIKDDSEKIDLILDFISLGPDYSFLGADLLFIEHRLSREQQTRTLEIVLGSDSVLSISRFTQSKDIEEREPYRIVDYYDMLIVLWDNDLKKKAVEFLIDQIEKESSNYLARTTIVSICQLTDRKKSCRSILKEYDEENEWPDGTDSINQNSKELIAELIEKVKDQPR